MEVALVEPEIPPNTGNVARLCACTGASLHLVRPLGFSTDDRYLRRAGLDYWHLLNLQYHENLDAFLEATAGRRRFFLSARAERSLADVRFASSDLLVFGKETSGLPADLLQREAAHAYRIPMISNVRSLNLSNSVAVVLYEALRQLGYPGLR
ncbi:MAG: tRNA (uridine(34)/cytosine(34)/5-carboxymethylaminomethyluridine(34)-2'-O)-methyltransferase TrmL [Bacillota bacterium]